MNEFDGLKNKLEQIRNEKAMLIGREQELKRQKEELIAKLAKHGLTIDNVGMYVGNLKQELDKAAQSIDSVLKDINSNV